ncbi:MAG: cytochrome c biogenesis protein CcsA [Planctomycetes bacterium]|nr:cytochrome c biogenesis protein CcsA [Planctomycetota bacterium]
MAGKLTVKYTIQGVLIYSAMLGCLLAFLATMANYLLRKAPDGGGVLKLHRCMLLFAFVSAAAAFAYRWADVGHVPMQNIFEVFLCMGMLTPIVSIFCRRYLSIPGQSIDALLALAMLVPAGFVFSAGPQKLPPALQSPLFAPHVATYMLAYVVLAKAGILALAHMLPIKQPHTQLVPYEQATYRLVCLGFPLLTLGLVLGATWGKMAWGDYWNWDPKELWSLATWLIYAIYLHFRYTFGERFKTAGASLAVAGFAAIVITLLWVNLARIFAGLHSYA